MVNKPGPDTKIGKNIAAARREAGSTQVQLADALGSDRSAVARIESGERKISATELVTIADALEQPIEWFVTEPPPTVISRRRDATVGGHDPVVDRRIERLAHDIHYLKNRDILDTEPRPELRMPGSFAEAEETAAETRRLLEVGEGPILDLQRQVERLGLLAFSLELGDRAGDAAYVEVGGAGVALVNSTAQPGRRRFNLAHELGHHLFGDAYAPETRIQPGDATERMVNAFVAHLLMPSASVEACWSEVIENFGGDERLAAVAVAARYRVSWSAACSHLKTLDHLDEEHRDRIAERPPTRADLLELGESWTAELDAPSVPPQYGRQVLAAYRHGVLTAERTVELLWRTVERSELPELRPVPLEGFKREFEPLA